MATGCDEGQSREEREIESGPRGPMSLDHSENRAIDFAIGIEDRRRATGQKYDNMNQTGFY